MGAPCREVFDSWGIIMKIGGAIPLLIYDNDRNDGKDGCLYQHFVRDSYL